jgi:hypothetical protein
MPPPKHILEQYKPPVIPGWTCIQTAFKCSNAHTIENMARAMGYEVIERGGPTTWRYIPSDALGAILGTLAQSAEEAQDARTVTKEHVSCRLLDMRLKTGSAGWARLAGLSVKTPGPESEPFVRMDEVTLIVGLAAQSNVFPPGTVPADLGRRCLDWIETNGLAGITERQARREKRLPGGY